MDSFPVSFENTKNAFAYKSDRELRKASFLFSLLNYAWVAKLGSVVTPWAIKAGLPVKGLIRNTIFEQFVGGETLEETALVAVRMEKFGVKLILDYGVEGREGESNFDESCESFIRVIDYAASQPGIPFISIKVTGLARFALLEKLDAAANDKNGFSGTPDTRTLDGQEKQEWDRVVKRMQKIVEAAAEKRIGVLVDAEESWVQDPIDALTMQFMAQYNRERAVVYNTVQLYRTDRLDFLRNSFGSAGDKGFLLGVKLVRGAYMEKERKRALELHYPSPVQPDKAACDRDYDQAVQFGIEHCDRIAMIIATHNEKSNLLATQLMKEKGIPADHPHVHFSQLFGMSDNITFNLAKSGYSVSKYLPFGPIGEVIPYLMRRAQENSSVSGQTGRELGLIRKEIRRRRRNIL